MEIKETIKAALRNNPIALRRRMKMRSRLKNRDFSFLCPNCIGGILFHDLGLKFLSPTINLMMTQTDFLQFVLHLKDYLCGKLRFVVIPDETCPCAELTYDDLPPVTLYFTHYKTAEEAEEKWIERAKRINFDNLFVLIEERDGITKEDLCKLAELPVRGVVAFTCNMYPDIPYAVYLPQYHKDGEVGNIIKSRRIDDSREYERYFDFVSWFNEANGRSFDVHRFLR